LVQLEQTVPLIRDYGVGLPLSHIGKANSLDGLTGIYRTEGMRGLYKGSLLALVGVSNGSIQFATYEDLKRRRTEAKRRKFQKSGKEFRIEDEKLVRWPRAELEICR
jgi:hypothetical protein